MFFYKVAFSDFLLHKYLKLRAKELELYQKSLSKILFSASTMVKKRSLSNFSYWIKFINLSFNRKNRPVKDWGGLSKMSKNVKISIHPTTHRWEWLHKSKIVKDNWIISIRLWFIWLLVIWHNSSPQPTHQTIHPPMSGGVSMEFKSSSRIELSWLIQDLLNCY